MEKELGNCMGKISTEQSDTVEKKKNPRTINMYKDRKGKIKIYEWVCARLAFWFKPYFYFKLKFSFGLKRGTES